MSYDADALPPTSDTTTQGSEIYCLVLPTHVFRALSLSFVKNTAYLLNYLVLPTLRFLSRRVLPYPLLSRYLPILDILYYLSVHQTLRLWHWTWLERRQVSFWTLGSLLYFPARESTRRQTRRDEIEPRTGKGKISRMHAVTGRPSCSA